jgi:acetyltransferase
MAEMPPSMLSRFTLIDYDREMALCAVIETERTAADGSKERHEKMIGVSRYITNPDLTSCEFSLVVADEYAGQGLGTRLMLSIMDVARDKGLQQMEGLVLTHNGGMLRLMRSLGFEVKAFPEDPDFRLVTHLL